MKSISVLAGKDKNYLKLRRDEFDALPGSSSHRIGFKSRPPAMEVLDNIAILCPNHHRLIHKLNPIFENHRLSFLLDGEEILNIELDYHLKVD